MRKLIVFSLLNFLFINVWAVEDATLKNIKVNDKACECVEYKCEMEISESSVNITYELSDLNAIVDRESGISTAITSDVTNIKVNVTNGESHNVYEFIITKHVKSSDFTLKELFLNEEEIALMDDVFVYNFAVSFDEENVIIEAVPNDSKASVDKELAFLFPIDESSRSFDFKVTAENGAVKNYRIFVTRKNKPDTTLKSLKIDKGTIDFSKDVFEYKFDVDYVVNDIIVEAIPSDENASVKIVKNTLSVGENVISIEVSNETVKSVYTLNINRSPNLDKSQANLSSLVIMEYPELDFDPNILEYELVFGDIPSSLTIDAKSVKDDTKIEIIDNNSLEKDDIVTVKVSLNDSDVTRIYTLKIGELDMADTNKLSIVIAIIILVITIVVLIILNIRDSNKSKKSTKSEKKGTIDKNAIIENKEAFVEEIEVI